jgi:hypothetical protein
LARARGGGELRQRGRTNKASREETAGEFAPAVVSVYGDLAPVYELTRLAKLRVGAFSKPGDPALISLPTKGWLGAR